MLLRASLLLALALWAELALGQPSAFVPTPGPVAARFEASRAAGHRFVRVDLAALQAQARVGGALTLDLLGPEPVVAVADRVERRGDGRWSWFGHVRGRPAERVSLTVERGLVVGRVVSGGAVYMVEPIGDGAHVLYAYAPDPDDEACEPPPAPETRDAAPPGRATGASPTTDARPATEPIDVLVVYTADVVAATGEASAQAHAQAMIDVLNESFVGAGLAPSARLADARATAYVASGTRSSYTELLRLHDRDDRHLDEVHVWRDEAQADVVVLLTEEGGGNCGIAFQLSTVARASGREAFAVVRRSCSVAELVFPHEFGHLIGIRHDAYVDTGTSPAPDSRGFVNTDPAHNAPFRTAVAYSTECRDLGISCPRVPAFSTTSAQWGGDALGSASADAARTLRTSVPTVAAYRDPAIALPDPLRITTTILEDALASIPLAAQIQDAIGDPRAQVLTLGTPTVGTISGTGRITYRPPPNYFGTASFSFTYDDEAGLVGAGVVEVEVVADDDPPTSPTLVNPGPQNVPVHPDATGAFRVEWQPSRDVDGDPVSYRWLLTADAEPIDETNPALIEIDAGSATHADVPLDRLYALMAGPIRVLASGVGVVRHRVEASDGTSAVEGPTGILFLRPSGTPAEPPPDPTGYDGPVAARGPFPSPARGRVAFHLDLPANAAATLTLYDALGRLAFERRVLLGPGVGVRAEWEAAGLAPGVYVYRIAIDTAEGDGGVSGRLVVVD